MLRLTDKPAREAAPSALSTDDICCWHLMISGPHMDCVPYVSIEHHCSGPYTQIERVIGIGNHAPVHLTIDDEVREHMTMATRDYGPWECIQARYWDGENSRRLIVGLTNVELYLVEDHDVVNAGVAMCAGEVGVEGHFGIWERSFDCK